MNIKQKKIKIEPRIKLNYDICTIFISVQCVLLIYYLLTRNIQPLFLYI